MTSGAGVSARDEIKPFEAFDLRPFDPAPLRRVIAETERLPERDCVPSLIDAAALDPLAAGRVRTTARKLVQRLRAEGPDRGVSGLLQEYALSSVEGVALMCLAEALLRIPDSATRDALIRDKVAGGNWRAHMGPERSIFVNAATWGLMITGSLTAAMPEEGLARALNLVLARGGEPLIRAGMDFAMLLMGEQFVMGETIGEALSRSQKLERRGFRHSFDMLGEAAMTAADAERYLDAYRNAIEAIGAASAGRGPQEGPGISIKLSALHPRYRRQQRSRVMGELLPRLRQLALQARAQNIGLNIDAEEADRLELSLDLLEALCLDPAFDGWDGIGFVIQAYGRRCSFLVDWLVDLARRSRHRLMVRLVKGAYWDSEIKQAQVEGLADYPVFTRKTYTDVSYIVCARKLLAAPREIFPQFATHNAHTVAAIYEIAGPDFYPGQYEFQCLHGMGEQLYSAVVGKGNLDRPCRIYAPVGTHATLLAYLVRRLLENGANTSFVNRIADGRIAIEDLIADPVEIARGIAPLGAPHPGIKLPRDILGQRQNSAGLDFSSEPVLQRLASRFRDSAAKPWRAVPLLADGEAGGTEVTILNPADNSDVVGIARFATPQMVSRAFAAATPDWAPPEARARCLLDAADRLEAASGELMGLMVREAGKTVADALAEVREAVDFLRYYGGEAQKLGEADRSLGTVVCISPWNFPLSIFTGQIAAALAAGNAVLAKPAEETPLVAFAMTEILHAAGIPPAALQLLPGAGDIGAALVGHAGVSGVAFTGSLEVARAIQHQLADRILPDGAPAPLIAETGGQNAMIVDSSALAEQVVTDVLSSAYDSAGQRCSALRLLCVQEDVAERTLEMLKGAMRELSVGNPDRLATDIGPVITAEARDRLLQHIELMRGRGHAITQIPLGADTEKGTFLPPTLIEINHIEELTAEVFGPVLHVVRYRREDLDRLAEAISGLGYGLTFGLHTRLDETVERVVGRIGVGNIYVNRNIIGAVVGVQPFGGQGLSGTGPKAGGPLYLRRLLSRRSGRAEVGSRDEIDDAGFSVFMAGQGREAQFAALLERSPAGVVAELPGPVGENNLYRAEPRGEILLLPQTYDGFLAQLGAVFATGNRAVVDASAPPVAGLLQAPPPAIAARLRTTPDWHNETGVHGVLVEGDPGRVAEVSAIVAGFEGPIITVQGAADYNLDLLVREVSVSINTAAAGGNASLMALKET
ncbi:MAG TPA: bifunctional proline dehydrogenase/L-glutamate gamma-semialdehyde dehydrogenase PutA [Devosiaceae bacterium]|nr:bifunctional proline dehydrogenase/L-glutamate gamma-semialdehyde dehydrogenase PutA [Devosiaceae bacterium]